MNEIKRKIWEQPWGYSEGFIVASGIALTGFVLQQVLGNIDPVSFGFPINKIIGAIFVISIILLYFLLKHSKIIRWLSSGYTTIPAICVLLVFIIIMGIIPQFSDSSMVNELPQDVFNLFGLYQTTTSWIFILLSFYLLTILGFTILKRTQRKQTWRDIGFYLNHVGLFIAFLAGILGSADLQKLNMHVSEGNAEWRAVNNNNEIVELPLAIQLDTFIIEEYPPTLALIDNRTEKMLPVMKPEIYHYDEKNSSFSLADKTVEILQYIPNAAVVKDSMHVNVFPYYEEGAASALKIRVTGKDQSNPVEGWVSCGSFLFPYNVLYIDKNTSAVMPKLDVKRYQSDVTIFTKDGETKRGSIEVNKPMTVEGWRIYQISYDTTKGKYSDISIFELVHDPWQPAVYVGIFMLLGGAIFLFVIGPKKRE
ncbi:MAG: cytochrome c biogenesis protein ResB [Dysgonamonadaceae bacterium]